MLVPNYPDFIPLDVDLKEILHPRLSLTSDGVSEFTFSGLYLFRNRYNYRVSRNEENGGFIISGEQPASADNPQVKTFFMTPCGAPDLEILLDLFKTHDYWKNISESVLSPAKENLEKHGIVFTEDRDNFDYLYYRSDLAELAGKKYHKKKNHVNHFLHTYPDYEQKQMNASLVPAAFEILDQWHQDKSDDGDYRSAREALDLFDTLTLRGAVFFVAGKPAAYCLGESIARGRMFAIHFEKAIDEYKGIYQFMNQAFAASLPRFFTLINREQDLGSEGLRQAKMTYRPCGFVQKYTGKMS
ncbi:MAG: phosphatidylglycerol lysyltransferase domain-containing protein [Treponema sp.]|jgi:hypothetical protein|nr:phosphatidylglycerol lysyltransferase domain-containing protein [Treponema sp.]